MSTKNTARNVRKPAWPGPGTARRSARSTWRTKPVLSMAGVAAVLTSIGLAIVSLQPASANAGISTTANVNLRSGPGTSYEVLEVIPAGTSPSYLCFEQAQDVEGVDVWFRVEWNGTVGFISSYYDTSSYHSDNDIPAKYGIDHCSDAIATDGTADPFNRDAAANWAYAHATDPQDFAAGCTWFVSKALWAAGIPKSDDWTDDGTHGNWPWSTRPGTPEATAVQPFIDAFMRRFPASAKELLDLSHNAVPDAENGDLIAYDWDSDGAWDHLSIVTSISSGQYPNVAEWGTAHFTLGHASIDYHERGWTWSQNNNEWLQQKYPAVRAMLIHINTAHPSTF